MREISFGLKYRLLARNVLLGKASVEKKFSPSKRPFRLYFRDDQSGMSPFYQIRTRYCMAMLATV